MRHRRFKQAVSFLTTSSILAGLILPGASVLADSYDDIVLADVFPDEILRQCIADEYDGDKNGILTPEELGSEPLRISYMSKGITDITGLDRLPNLRDVNLENNDITSVNVGYDGLFSLDLGGNEGLTYLDISLFPGLQCLDLHDTGITELDISSNDHFIDAYSNGPQTSYYSGGVMYTSNDSTGGTFFVDGDVVITGVPGPEESDPEPTVAPPANIVDIDEEHFPDDTFREYIGAQFDTDGDNALSTDEIAEATYISVEWNSISSLEGIEYLTELTSLYCNGNDLTMLDLSSNTKLTILDCSNNNIDELYLDGGIARALTEGYREGSTYIFDEGDEYYSVSVDTATKVYSNGSWINEPVIVTAIDEYSFPDDNFREFVLSEYDADSDGNLSEIEIDNAIFMNCDGRYISDLTGIEFFTELTSLDCSDNELTELDISANAKVTSINATNNLISSLTLNGNPDIGNLCVGSNPIETIDLTEYPILLNVYTYGQQDDYGFYSWSVAEEEGPRDYSLAFDPSVKLYNDSTWINPPTIVAPIDEETFPDDNFRQYVLDEIDADNDDQLSESEINITREISCSYREIKDLTGIEYFTSLVNLYCQGNEISELDVSMLTDLRDLDCSDNDLTYLNVSGLEELWYLNASANDLTELDISDNELLHELYVTGTPIVELDITSNSYLHMAVTMGELQDYSYTYRSDSGYATLAAEFSTKIISDDYWLNEPVNVIEIEDYFPDEAFREVISSRCDRDGDGWLSELEINATRTLDIGSCGIRNLAGIDCFTSLMYLYGSFNNILLADLSSNNELRYIDLSNNGLRRLMLPEGDELEGNDLYEINVLGSRALSLDITDCPYLIMAFNEGTYNEGRSRYEYSCSEGEGESYREIDCCIAMERTVKLYIDGVWMNETDMVAEINEETFPDPAFRDYVLESIDFDEDGVLSTVEVNSTNSIRCSELGIEDLTGIEFFTDLSVLDCSNNDLKTLDLSGLSNLRAIDCSCCDLEELRLPADAELIDLRCHRNRIESVDLTGCDLILEIYENSTDTEPDYSSYSYYIYDMCTGDSMESGYFSFDKRTALYSEGEMIYDPGDLIIIDEINFPDDNFRDYVSNDLDPNNDMCLSEDEIAGINRIVVADMGISDLKGIEFFTELTILDCSDNCLDHIDISANTKLKTFRCSGGNAGYFDEENDEWITDNQMDIERLDLSYNTALTDVDVSDIGLREIDVSMLTELDSFLCDNNDIASFDFSNNPKITVISIRNSNVSSVTFGDNPLLKNLDVAFNDLTELDLSSMEGLMYLSATENRLGSIDVSACPILMSLEVEDNELTDLDIGNNEYLESLYCSNNDIGTLDLSNAPYLEFLACSNCGLTSLDLQNNGLLVNIYASQNNLEELDVSACRYLFEPALFEFEGEPSFYIDNGVAVYWLETENYSGVKLSYDVNTRLITADTPTAPTGLKKDSVTMSSVTVSWNKVENADSYEVYVRPFGTSEPWSSVGKTTKTSITATGLSYRNYAFMVVACKTDIWGNVLRSKDSASMIANPVATPADLKATATSTTTISLSWSSVSKPSDGTLIYEIWRNTTTTGTGACIGRYTGTSSVSKLLNANTTYYYRIRAYWIAPDGTKIYGQYSSWVSCKTPSLPAAPTGVVVTATDTTTLKIKWNAVAGATGYKVMRATSPGGIYTTLGTTTKLEMTNKITAGTMYYYKVVAYRSSSGTTEYGKESSVVTGFIPKAPSGLKVTGSSRNSISLSWNKITTSAGEGQIFYEVFRMPKRDAARPYTCIGIYDQNRTYNTSYNLAANTTYYYCIRAYYRYTDSNGTTRRIYSDYAPVITGKTK